MVGGLGPLSRRWPGGWEGRRWVPYESRLHCVDQRIPPLTTMLPREIVQVNRPEHRSTHFYKYENNYVIQRSNSQRYVRNKNTPMWHVQEINKMRLHSCHKYECLSACMFVLLALCLSDSVFLFVCVSLCFFVSLSTYCLHVCVPECPTCLLASLSSCLPYYLSVCLSFCIYFSHMFKPNFLTSLLIFSKNS